MIENAKFSGYCFYMNTNIQGDFKICISVALRTTDSHFRDQGEVRHSISKLLKFDLVQTLNTFRNPSLRIFAAEKTSLVLN